MHAIRLPFRARVGIGSGIAVELKTVVGSRPCIFNPAVPPIAIVGPFHGILKAAGFDRHVPRERSPNFKSMHPALLRAPEALLEICETTVARACYRPSLFRR